MARYITEKDFDVVAIKERSKGVKIWFETQVFPMDTPVSDILLWADRDDIFGTPGKLMLSKTLKDEEEEEK